MAHKKKSPPAATGGLGNCHRRAAFDVSEHSKSFPDLQRFRAAFLVRRHRLAPALARVVAELAFCEVRR